MIRRLLSALMIFPLLMACGAAHASIEKGQLTVWVNSDRGYKGLEKVASDFIEDTGIKVTVSHPDNADSKFQMMASTGNGPDIIMWNHEKFGQWARAGLIAQITPTEEVLKRFTNEGLSAMTVNGRLYGYPLAVEAISLICNNRYIRKRPQSFEEFMDIGRNLKEHGVTALEFPYTIPYFSYPFITAKGGYSFLRNARGYDPSNIGIANASTKEGISFMMQLVKHGYISLYSSYERMNEAFIEEKTACVLNGPWIWKKYDEKRLDYAVYPLPTLAERPTRSLVDVYGFVINTASPNKDLAIEFLENYVLTDDGLDVINNTKSIGVPALKSFEQKVRLDPKIAATIRNIENGEVVPYVEEIKLFFFNLEQALKNIRAGKENVSDAIDSAARRIVKAKNKNL